MLDQNIQGYRVRAAVEGGAGETVHATREDSGEACLIKRVSSKSDDKYIESILLKHHGLPSHDGIVGLVEYQKTTDGYLAITQCPDGLALNDISHHSRESSWQIIRSLADALGHAHKYGLVHGGLHLRNVFHNPDAAESAGHVVISDFGDYRLSWDAEVEYDETLYCSAPEQLEPNGLGLEGGAIEQADVYRFGVIAFYLLNGQLPRGADYINNRNKAILLAQGDSIPIDAGEFRESLFKESRVSWSRNAAVRPREHRWQDIIQECLDLDPQNRPKDMREVRHRLELVDTELALLDTQRQAEVEKSQAESEIEKEKLRQRSKIASARMAAFMLGLSCCGAVYFLFSNLVKSSQARERISELGHLVAKQNAHIAGLDETVQSTNSFLRQSREVADASFYQLTQNTSSPLDSAELERLREYYLNVLGEVKVGEGDSISKARALQSIAHIELALDRTGEAIHHFESAVVAFEKAGDEGSPNGDLSRRLADCYEQLGRLLSEVDDPRAADLSRRAIGHLKQLVSSDGSDLSSANRLALLSFKYGRLKHDGGAPDAAIEAYVGAAEVIETMLESGGVSDGPGEAIHERIARLQFRAALALTDLERGEEAVDSYIAAIESMDKLRGNEPYAIGEKIMLIRCFLGLGDTFGVVGSVKRSERDQVYNEALRLAAPLSEDEPRNVEIAALACQIMSRLAELERLDGQKKEGYRLSVRGIEGLIQALEKSPSHVKGFMLLAEARLNHLEFLKNDKKTAKVIALRGVDTAKHAHGLVQALPGDQRDAVGDRLKSIFLAYGEICRNLGQDKAAIDCSHFAEFTVGMQ